MINYNHITPHQSVTIKGRKEGGALRGGIDARLLRICLKMDGRRMFRVSSIWAAKNGSKQRITGGSRRMIHITTERKLFIAS